MMHFCYSVFYQGILADASVQKGSSLIQRQWFGRKRVTPVPSGHLEIWTPTWFFGSFASWKRPQQLHFGPILGPFAHPLLNLLRQTSGDVIHSCSGEPQHFYYGSNETVTWEQDRLTWGRFLVVAFVYCASTILEGWLVEMSMTIRYV